MQIGLEDRSESSATLTGGGAEAELVGRGAAAVLPGVGAVGFNSRCRWGEEQGVRGVQDPKAVSNCSEADSPAVMASGRNPARHGVTRLWLQWGRR